VSILLGVRLAIGGGRESLARNALLAAGVAVGVMLLLFTLTAMPVLQRHIDRLAWHRTTEASPPTAPDPALWLAVTDRYAGRDIIRVHVAALGSRPPVPPGVDRLPGPGEVVVSPALAELMRTVPDDQLRDRFPGRVVGTIGPDGLIAPAELVGIVGRTPEALRDTDGAVEIRGIEQPGMRISLYGFYRFLISLVAALIVGPVVVFVAMVTRIGTARRERRFAAIRLAGATRLQTAALAATETAGAATAGTLLGWLGYLAARPAVVGHVTLGHGIPIFLEDLAAPVRQMALVLVAVPVLAVATTVVALHRVHISPLGAHRRERRRSPRDWRLVPLVAGVVGVWWSERVQSDPGYVDSTLLRWVANLSPLAILVGLVLAGPLVCVWIGRRLARSSGRATTLIAARRIAADPYTTSYAVSGVALGMFVATTLGLIAAAERSGGQDRRASLHRGVVAVHTPGVPEASLAPLLSGGAVVARSASGQQVVVRCADLARVSDLTCPLPASLDGPDPQPEIELFVVPNLYGPAGFSEPGPEDAGLPVQTVFVPTDGTRAAEERVRTLAAVAVPSARTETDDELAARTTEDFAWVDGVLPPAMAFVLLVAACSLTVATVSGLMERRRPFALLRASGVRLGELRRIVLLETGLPLVVTTLAGMGTALLVTYMITPSEQWGLPDAGFFAGLGLAVAAALAVSSLALPLLDVATRHDSARFE
jgi:FtsX-like permease family